MLVTEELLITANTIVNGLTKLQALEQASATLEDDQAVIEQKVATNANEQGAAMASVADALNQLVDALAPVEEPVVAAEEATPVEG